MSDSISYMLKTSATQTLGAMASILQKSADHAAAIEVEESVFLNHRLAPDMFPLTRQIQIMTDTVARGGARLAGLEMPETPDTETSFAQLIARCHERLTYVQELNDASLNANELTVLEIPLGPMTVNWEGRQYLATFVLPNLHFHAATAYGLLRAQGVKIGKRDFLLPG
jgi:hypothetical protein